MAGLIEDFLVLGQPQNIALGVSEYKVTVLPIISKVSSSSQRRVN